MKSRGVMGRKTATRNTQNFTSKSDGEKSLQ
jgi:hypothetical protein